MSKTWIQDRTAINHLEKITISFKWMWREQPLLDHGIDGHIEICENGKPTGKLIAVQSKGGESYFYRRKDGKLTISLELRHILYWVEYALPVIVIGYLPSEKKSYWIYIQDYIDNHPHLIKRQQKRLSIPIPTSNVFDIESKQLLASIFDTHIKRLIFSIFSNYNIDMTLLEQVEAIAKKAKIDPGNFESIILRRILEVGTPLGRVVSLLAEGQNDKAKKPLESLISDTEKYLANQYAWLAGLFLQEGYYEDAMKYSNKSIELNPTDCYALNIRGACYAQAEEIEKAEMYFQKAIESSPNFAAPYANRGEVLMDGKKYREAISMFEEAIKRFPGKVNVLRMKADCHKHLKEFGLAKTLYYESIRIKETPDAWKGLGDIAYYQGVFEDAEEAYSKAIDHDKNFYQAFFNRGKARERIGRLKDALHDFHQCLALNPKYEPARKALRKYEASDIK